MAPILLTLLPLAVAGFENEFQIEFTKQVRVQDLPVEATVESYGERLEECDRHHHNHNAKYRPPKSHGFKFRRPSKGNYGAPHKQKPAPKPQYGPPKAQYGPAPAYSPLDPTYPAPVYPLRVLLIQPRRTALRHQPQLTPPHHLPSILKCQSQSTPRATNPISPSYSDRYINLPSCT